MGVPTEMEDASKLDAASGNKGFFAKLVTSGIDRGDKDTDYIKRCRRSLLNGPTVIAVATKDDEERNKARQNTQGARRTFHYFFRPVRDGSPGSLASWEPATLSVWIGLDGTLRWLLRRDVALQRRPATTHSTDPP